MTAIPMRLEDALRFNGYTIEQVEAAEFTITLPGGTMTIPAMLRSELVWQRDITELPRDSFYLNQLPIFDPAYRPVILSHILDRYSTRRISYNTPDQFGLAIRRWGNLNLGPQSIINRRYLSTVVDLPLTTQDGSIGTVTIDHARDATSDFPQGQLAGDLDYASFATDRNAETDETKTYAGRIGQSIMQLLAEQRAAYLNVDEELLTLMDSLFLGVWDRSELDPSPAMPYSAARFLPWY
jgi:hypothetical protein